MYLFFNRDKTLKPRIDWIYLSIRVFVLLCISMYVDYGDFGTENELTLFFIIATYLFHLVIFYFGIIDKVDIKLAYLTSFAYDLILIPSLVSMSGGMGSSFYLLYFLMLGIAAYVLTFSFATVIAALATLSYIIVITRTGDTAILPDLAFRLGFLWAFFLAISYASEYLRRSENRLVKLFDALNQRISKQEAYINRYLGASRNAEFDLQLAEQVNFEPTDLNKCRGHTIRVLAGDQEDNIIQILCNSLSECRDGQLTFDLKFVYVIDEIYSVSLYEHFDLAFLILNNCIGESHPMSDTDQYCEERLRLVRYLTSLNIPVIALYGHPEDDEFADEVLESGAIFSSTIPCKLQPLEQALDKCLSISKG